MIRIKNNATPRLPSEYQEVEYIQGTGTQYIDTQYKMTATTSVQLKVTITNPITSSLAIGCWDTNLNGFLFGIDADGQFRFAYANGGWNGESVTYDLNPHIIYVDGANAKLDGVVKATAGNKTIATTSNIYLLWVGSYQKLNKANARIYYCKIYNNDILIRDFVPCYRKVDNVVGLYDLVNDVFYINTGTGTFLMGVEVNKPYINLRPMVGSKKLTKRYVGENLIYGEVEPSYEQKVNYTILYDNGDECTALTGGLKVSSRYNNAIATKYTDHIYLHTSTASAVTNNLIDLTQYVKFGGVLKNIVSTTGQARFAIGKSNSATDGTSLGWDGIAGNKVYNLTKSYSHFVGFYDFSKDESYYPTIVISDRSNNAYCSVYNMFLLKQDDWQTLCTKAGFNSSDYTDEATLCADSTAIAKILSSKSALQYMIYNCTGSFMGEFIANDECLTALNNSAYKTVIQANWHWNKFLNMVA